MTKWKKIMIAAAAIFAVVFLAVWIGGGAIAAHMVTQPRHRTFEDPETLADRPVENVTLRTEDGITLSAWHVVNAPDRAVIFLAGIGADRRQFRSRAEYYLATLGYSVLMPDLRGTGKSGGDLISIGWHERKDLAACRAFLRERGYRHIGAHGISLGAATICYSLKESNDLAFAVLESSYDTIDNAIFNRVDLYHVPHFLIYPGRLFLHWRMGASAREMQPLAYMPYCTMPTLVMAGDAEGFLKLSETMDIYNRCAAGKKRLHIFKGGRHENFLGRYPDEFKNVLGSFIAEAGAEWPPAPSG